MLPSKSILIQNKCRSNDVRGEIKSIVDTEVKNVSIITCNENTIRSNHYHKKDFHFMYVLKGVINYFFSDLEMNNIKYLRVETGQTIFTPCLEIHSTHFPVDTTLIVSSGFPRDQKTYESDTVRVDFINEENINKFIKEYGQINQ